MICFQEGKNCEVKPGEGDGEDTATTSIQSGSSDLLGACRCNDGTAGGKGAGNRCYQNGEICEAGIDAKETTTPTPEITTHFSMEMGNLDYNKLTEAQKEALSIDLAGVAASSFRVPAETITDMQGLPQRVTLSGNESGWSDADDVKTFGHHPVGAHPEKGYTMIDGRIEQSKGKLEVMPIVKSQEWQAAVVETVKTTVGAESPAIKGPLGDDVRVRAWDENQLWPVGQPDHDSMNKDETTGSSFPWWAWLLLLLLCCCLLAAAALYFYNLYNKPKKTKREAVAIEDDDTDIDSGLEEAQTRSSVPAPAQAIPAPITYSAPVASFATPTPVQNLQVVQPIQSTPVAMYSVPTPAVYKTTAVPAVQPMQYAVPAPAPASVGSTEYVTYRGQQITLYSEYVLRTWSTVQLRQYALMLWTTIGPADLFALLDTNHDGVLSRSEFAHLRQDKVPPIADQELVEWILLVYRTHLYPLRVAPASALVGLDTTGDGRANYYVQGGDANRDGIPDVLQTGQPIYLNPVAGPPPFLS
jgi:hypothetical protein